MRINCFQCQYFKVTWDQNNPRGCTAYGFKTKQLPSVVVKQSSGMECMKFVPKTQEGKR
ncbi:uracil-DNA glycosylase [Butyricicoccus sp. 1XD8-22]|nr:uracil-DNA glycosylase [Butyricicoccus sp. 1XD8-22]